MGIPTCVFLFELNTQSMVIFLAMVSNNVRTGQANNFMVKVNLLQNNYTNSNYFFPLSCYISANTYFSLGNYVEHTISELRIHTCDNIPWCFNVYQCPKRT